MTGLKKPASNSQAPSQNALPGVFALLETTHAFVLAHKEILAGFAAWTLFPTLFALGLPYLPDDEVLRAVTSGALTVADIVLGVWVTGALILTYLLRDAQEKSDAGSIGGQAWSFFPVLLPITGITFIVLVAGVYAFLVPGIIAGVWLAFANAAAVDARLGIFASIKKSRDLSRGRFFKVAGRLLGGNLVILAAYSFITLLVLGIVGAVGNIDFAALAPKTYEEFQTFLLPPWLNALASALFVPFLPYLSVYTTALYEALKKT